jgi:hypothetical protein
MASDPLTDWTTQEALYVKNNFPAMIPVFETINEIWNGLTDAADYSFAKTKVKGFIDQQLVTTSALSNSGDTLLRFTTVPAYVQVGTGVVDATNSGGINVNARVTAINRGSSPQTVTITPAVLGAGVASGDTIAFAWSAAILGEPFGGVWSPEQGGAIASTMCQAVANVYGGDPTKYHCATGLNTNGEGYQPNPEANARILSQAYVGQNTANIPIQSGCAGANSVQTNCPVPFIQAAAFNYLTHVDLVNYWNIGECACSGGYQPSFSVFSSPQEVMDAYNYFTGNSTTQASIMTSYIGTYTNQYISDTIANFNTYIYPGVLSWATGCGTGISPSSCHIKGLLFYEGSYSTCLIPASGGTACGGETAGDKAVAISGATPNGSTCNLASTMVVNGFINDGGAAGDGIVGNRFTPSSSTGVPLGATITSGATGTPKIIGLNGTTNYTGGYTINGAAQYVNTTNFTLAANGAVAGMTVK